MRDGRDWSCGRAGLSGLTREGREWTRSTAPTPESFVEEKHFVSSSPDAGRTAAPCTTWDDGSTECLASAFGWPPQFRWSASRSECWGGPQ